MPTDSERRNQRCLAYEEFLIGQQVKLTYFMRLRNDRYCFELVVRNPISWMFVETPSASGPAQRWRYLDKDGERVFTSPDGYVGGPILFVHDKAVTSERIEYVSTKVFGFLDPCGVHTATQGRTPIPFTEHVYDDASLRSTPTKPEYCDPSTAIMT